MVPDQLRDLFKPALLCLAVIAGWVVVLNYLHRNDDAERIQRLQNDIASINQRAPILEEPEADLYLTRMAYDKQDGFFYEYQFKSLDAARVDAGRREKIREWALNRYCTRVNKQQMQEVGGETFRYLAGNGSELFTLKPLPRDCTPWERGGGSAR